MAATTTNDKILKGTFQVFHQMIVVETLEILKTEVISKVTTPPCNKTTSLG